MSTAQLLNEHFDVLIVGAGLSGIGAGYHLKTACPKKSFAILEARDSIGGTWDLFRYPGIRSDSDMYTLGYSFKPWLEAKAIADGPSILKYVIETARENNFEQRIRFQHRVVRASWSTPDACWTIDVERGPNREPAKFTCNFLFMCSGYYSYKEGYTPDFAGTNQFKGRIVHPQKWPNDLNYAGKRVVVIGSGATAVTLVPEMAKTAAHVTMLQRSPTYVVSLPAQDRIANVLRKILPMKLAYGMVRWKNVSFGMLFFWLSKHKPNIIKRMVRRGLERELGANYDIDTHFTPRYNPWDQRMCLVPDADLFNSIKNGSASVVTDHIDMFTEKGLKLKSGRELEADIIVTATGLNLAVLGEMQVDVDGKRINASQTMSYKGMMYSEIPNLASAFGYTNASWTLKCDLTCAYVCRLINYMDQHGYRQCTARENDPSVARRPWIDFSSGYIRRGIDKFPKQGSKAPWKLYQNYALDIMSLRYGSIEDSAMEFSNRAPMRKAS
jgi:cation diffusion facilitator CzcD-associated flavoprotein CzcO